MYNMEQPVFVDIKTIPEFLGEDWTTRIEKWLEYKDRGIMLIDTSKQ